MSHQAHNLYVVLKALEQKDPERVRVAMESHVDLNAEQIKDKFL